MDFLCNGKTKIRKLYDGRIAYIVNPDSPFCVEKIGEIRRVCSGGEFDNIYTTQLALERASYENWTTTRFTDSISLTCVAVPWLDVNEKIAYTSPMTGEVITCLIEHIELNLAEFTMELRLQRFYPYYPFTDEKND